MSMPEGAQLSEDGNYWWDEPNSVWKVIGRDPGYLPGGDGGGGTLPGGDGGGGTLPGGDAGPAVIIFTDVDLGDSNVGPGPLASVDPDDNAAGHYVLKSDSGVQVVWGEANAGTGEATYSDSVKIDGTEQTVDNLTLAPGQSATRSAKLGRLSEGEHTVEVVLSGGATGSNTFQVDAP